MSAPATKGFQSLNAAAATGAGTSLNVPAGHRNFSIQCIVAGSPATCIVKLEGSNDGGTTYFTLQTWDITTPQTSGDILFAVDKPVAIVRANCTTLTTGSGKNVSAYIVSAP